MRKIGNFLLYIVALLFLGYHLFPVGASIAQAVADKTSAQTTLKELTDNAQCVPTDGAYDRLTYGNPLTEPLYTTLPYKDPAQIPVTGTNIFPNSALGSIDPETKLPKGWVTSLVGANNGKFSLTAGPRGTVATRVEITQYKDGDAKWAPDPIKVKPGEYYRFESQYRTSAYAYAMVDFAYADGNHNYVILQPMEPSGSDWRTYRTSLVVPANVATMSISQVVDQAGTLDTAGFKLVKQQLPQFNRGLVSLNFDDGWRSIYENGMPLFDKYDIKTTQFIVSGVLDDKAYMTPKMIDEFEAKGHEVGSHTMKHEDLATTNSDNTLLTLAGSHSTLNYFYNWRAHNFAPPYGHYNDAVKSYVQKCYASMRGTESGFNTAEYDRYDLKVMNIEVNTKPEEVATAVRFARDHKLWLILVYHEIDSRSESSYAASLGDLEKQLQIIKEEQVPVVTISQGLAETLPQLHR
jgi:peptidoglycan/xylan/chitin deacetylase (PgdA/CDA1 family)